MKLAMPARWADWPEPFWLLDFPVWKHPHVRRMLAPKALRFVRGSGALKGCGTLVLWGLQPLPRQWPAERPVLRLEDGFLRSVGLGAELTRPLSWVADGQGMYYDATRPSDLEQILGGGVFAQDLLDRARCLRERVVAAGVSKYNVGSQVWRRPAGRDRIILVVGQVESDAAIAFGCPGIRRNLDLLRAVRAQEPDAYIVYKPHPDVEAGLRRAGHDEDQAAAWSDAILRDVSIAQVLHEVDAVHVLTSLAGFEALLRERQVICWGMPFYAGWGLTEDKISIARRTTRLSLDALVAGALILYPRYFAQGPQGPLPVEAALDCLERWKAREEGRRRWWQPLYRAFLRRWIGVR